MKLNKTFGRIATTLVATAMLASMAVVPAFAETGVLVPEGESAALEKIEFTKELVIPADAVTPTQTFTFNIEPVTDVTNETIDTKTGAKVTVRDGIIGVDDAGSVTIDVNDSRTANDDGITATVTDTVTINSDKMPGGFTDAGVYKYKITEDDVTGADADRYADKTEQLYLYLIVERDSDADVDSTQQTDYYIASAVLKNVGGDKVDTYTNWYDLGEGPTPEVQTGALSVTKNVAGVMGSMGDQFTFTVSNLTALKSYKIQKNDEPEQTVQADENGTYSFDLGHNDTLTIKGLDEGYYTITEAADDSTAKGYTSTFNKDDNQDTEGTQGKVTKKVTNALICTNTREAVSPTGLVMDIAPYALLVVVAAAGCFVFLRKRRED